MATRQRRRVAARVPRAAAPGLPIFPLGSLRVGTATRR